MSDIKHERGVTFADMLSGQFPVYPDFGCVEYGFKFDPHRRVLPFTRSVKGSLIPSDTSIVEKSRVNLPSVRHAHRAPKTGGLGFVPTLLLTGASRIRAKPPLAAETYLLRQGYVRRVRARRKYRRANSASRHGPGLSQEFQARMH